MAAIQPTFAGALPAAYDSLMGPIFFEPFARAVADRFRGASGAILETAAGTGRLTRALADVVAADASITATDLAGPMIAHAAETLTDPRITWQQADAQRLPFADA
ncbi:MAG: class I SAM-dependent methyltransferase, partial [Mesorhizobium sp.]